MRHLLGNGGCEVGWMGGADVLGGRYELLRLLGRGGMGEVWEAVDRVVARRVAVKTLLPASGADSCVTSPADFEREARTLATLQHPGIVVVHDFGADGQRLFLVMELLLGRNLGKVLQETGPWEPEQVADALRILARALRYAHRAGVVHRDLKPANVMVGPDGTLKVCDFGIAKLAGETAGAGGFVGTPAYAAPEQVQGLAVDHRADLYSLGCIAYQLLTGAPPFESGHAAGILFQQVYVEPPPLDAARVPEPLASAVRALLMKDPGQRPDDASRLLDLLEPPAPMRPVSWVNSSGAATGFGELNDRQARFDAADDETKATEFEALAMDYEEFGAPFPVPAFAYLAFQVRLAGGWALHRLDRWSEAADTFGTAARWADGRPGYTVDLAKARHGWGASLCRDGRQAEAVPLLELASAALEEAGPALAQEASEARGMLGVAYTAAGGHPRAEAHVDHALSALDAEGLGAGEFALLLRRARVQLLDDRGALAEGFAEVMRLRKDGDDSYFVWQMADNLSSDLLKAATEQDPHLAQGALLAEQRQYVEALAQFDTALAERPTGGPRPDWVALRARTWRAGSLRELGRTVPAREEFRVLVAELSEAIGNDSDLVSHFRLQLGELCLLTGRPQEAVELYQHVVDANIARVGPDDRRVLRPRGLLAHALRVLGRHRDFKRECTAALAGYDRLGLADDFTLRLRFALARTELEHGLPALGVDLLRNLVRQAKVTLGASHPDTLTYERALHEHAPDQGREQDR
ncbi:serine/threonine-protein kinase [Streptomyces bambusae]|uniref:serine/threonine-protein kinase n=1 Tax=Streptomyces bambusae TaxID=1550616 RepID=UPI001CA47466|nr:serine/threonine-protein kinase [Streptomyces bambusae]